MSMETVSQALAELKIVPVVSVPSVDHALPLGDALAAGGLPIAEVTFRTAAAEASIDALRSGRPDLLVGAGTVLDVPTARRALAAGAQFAVTPGFNPAVVDFFLENDVPIVPGASTPTEIDMCLARGLSVVKFFPAEASGGVGYLKAISAPYSTVRFMPTGGITLNTITDYLVLPSVIACGGTWLASSDLLARGDYAAITDNVRAVVARTATP